ncbi:BON domain-containing protein [Methylobacterium sp.]|jgi:osmotically-inducible protein OsmY|uniref:BON domain-containing protein n=1 Tax=Methylobacterium sp. TaxID=409 RepID=UPI002613E8DF|nr:BON domain-containing protein [Methylobacterium sp.]MDB5648349.1 Ornithine aminotransferase [Methylobacterium sp.]
MDDTLLRQHILEELDFDPSVGSAHIGVAVDDGVVTISGHVVTYAEKIAAEKVVQRVRGVRAIAEELDVRKPDTESTGDVEIAGRVLNVLAWDSRIQAHGIQVKVERGAVTLTGTVPYYFQSVAAASDIRRLSGVTDVLNLLAVRPPAEAVDVKAKILAALKRNAKLDGEAIQVTVVDDEVTLEGFVNAWHERDIAERAAWSAPGVRAVVDRLMLA